MGYKLSLGCGRLREKGEGWIHIDKLASVEPDYLLDFIKGFPLTEPWGKDNSVDFILARCCFGQIEKNEDFLHVMNECWRVLKPEGEISIYLPHKDHPNAWVDPFNVRRFSEISWQTFDRNHPQYKNHNQIYGFFPWKVLNVSTNQKGFMSIRMKPDKSLI